MKGTILGIIYCALWYGSILSGFLMIACPLLPLLILSPIKFRKCGDFLFSCWELYPAALLHTFGIKIAVSGDHIHPNESAVLIMNHRTRVDWNFLWAAMYQACLPSIGQHKLKFVLKDPIKHIPGPGWTMQINGFLYITRNWDEDKGRISRALNYLIALSRRTQILIFPEGFSYLVQLFQQANFLDAVYDLTIAYPDSVPQTEIDLITGKFPKEVHFHIERIPSVNIPTQDVTLRNWLENRWLCKENTLEQFYKKKAFSDQAWPMTKLVPLHAALFFWSLLTGLTLIFLIVSPLFRLWALFNALLFVGISLLTNGFHEIEMNWYWKWRTLFCHYKNN
ncbi:lysocardiolipin acyltransferase 1-like isoform X2 [Prorops nasuta]|uniref:lysocardiolipin acyltransferase 1-like isoform X2 n=1 Tax=Prorops nasuta TaxID=863751 RepID=UPI0034CD6132